MIRASVIALLLLAWPLPSTADPNQYRPNPSGPPAGVYVGTLELYGKGTSSGAIEIRLRSGKLVQFFTAAGPTKIDGQQVACTVPPQPPSYRRDPVLCDRWPSNVRVGITRVRVPFWKGQLAGKATLIARNFTVVK